MLSAVTHANVGEAEIVVYYKCDGKTERHGTHKHSTTGNNNAACYFQNQHLS